MDEAFIGSIVLFAGNFAPQNWLFCQGQRLPINQYQALYSILGTTYGGDGINNFALPDLRGRVPVQAATGGTPPIPANTQSFALGQAQGSSTYTTTQMPVSVTGSFTLTPSQLPAHNHPATATVTIATASSADDNTPVGNVLAGGVNAYAGVPTTSAGALAGVSAAVTVGNTGNGTPVNVVSTGSVQPTNIPTQSPALGLNYIICVSGIYPVRP